MAQGNQQAVDVFSIQAAWEIQCCRAQDLACSIQPSASMDSGPKIFKLEVLA